MDIFLLLIFVIYGLLRNKTVVEKVLLKEQPDIIMVNSMTLLGIGGLAQKNGGKPSIERLRMVQKQFASIVKHTTMVYLMFEQG